MDAKLVVVSGSTKASEFTLRLPAVLGRGREATLMLPHPLVSRRHCEIFESNGYLVVRDMGSLNGTYVNHKRVTEAVLPPGGLLTLGSVTFQAVYDSSPAGATPPAAVPVAASPAAAAPKAGGGNLADLGDFEIVEVSDTPGPIGAKRPPKRVAQPSPPQPDSPPHPGPVQADDDLDGFLADFQ